MIESRKTKPTNIPAEEIGYIDFRDSDRFRLFSLILRAILFCCVITGMLLLTELGAGIDQTASTAAAINQEMKLSGDGVYSTDLQSVKKLNSKEWKFVVTDNGRNFCLSLSFARSNTTYANRTNTTLYSGDGQQPCTKGGVL